MSRRRIAVVTGSRADYGLLRWVMTEIRADTSLELQIIVTGMHLSPEFGLTYRDIEADGFTIADNIEMLMSTDSATGMAKSVGLGVIGFAECLKRLRPNIVVVLGDRFEIFAAAQAAAMLKIPTAHLHGGEVTEGAVDELFRHAITKLSYYHFVATEVYRTRVIRMGEEPNRVFNVGAPGLDSLKRLQLLNRQELEKALNFDLGARFLLVTYHPATLSGVEPVTATEKLLAAFDRFPDVKLMVTKPNADAGGRTIADKFEAYAHRQPDRVVIATSLGQTLYLSAMRHCTAVVGNSSSGIIEAPALPKASINIGPRQTGRLRATSILDCSEEAHDIEKAIGHVLSGAHDVAVRTAVSLYGDGTASSRVKQYLKTVEIPSPPVKRFYDGEPI